MTHDILDALQPCSTGCNYLNFTEVGVPASSAFDEGRLELLRAVRSAWDPDRVMVANHGLD